MKHVMLKSFHVYSLSCTTYYGTNRILTVTAESVVYCLYANDVDISSNILILKIKIPSEYTVYIHEMYTIQNSDKR